MKQTNIEKWLLDPGAAEYLGRHTLFKLEILACVVNRRGSLAEIARRFGATRQAGHFHARAARKAFGMVKG